MNLQSKFGYCMTTETLLHFVSGTELRTDRQTDRRMDGRTDRQTDRRTDDRITRCPRRTFQAGGIKMTTFSTSLWLSDVSSSLSSTFKPQRWDI